MKKFTGLLVLALILSIAPVMTQAEYQIEEIVSLIGNNMGDSVLVTLVNGTSLWITETHQNMPTTYQARDTFCQANQMMITVCGRYIYAAVGCDFQPPQIYTFELHASFPCAHPTAVYMPMVSK